MRFRSRKNFLYTFISFFPSFHLSFLPSFFLSFLLSFFKLHIVASTDQSQTICFAFLDPTNHRRARTRAFETPLTTMASKRSSKNKITKQYRELPNLPDGSLDPRDVRHEIGPQGSGYTVASLQVSSPMLHMGKEVVKLSISRNPDLALNRATKTQ